MDASTIDKRLGPVAGLVLATLLLPAPAEAQFQMPQREERAHVRASLRLWRAELSGTFTDLDEELLNEPVEVADTLGLTDNADGVLADIHLTLGKRHRLIGTYSQVDHAATAELDETVFVGGREFQLNEIVDTSIQFREGHGYYNLMVVARPEVEVGGLVGAGVLELEGTLSSVLGSVASRFTTPVPLFGGNARLNPDGRVTGYVEVAGFPEVDIEGFSGSVLDWRAEAAFYPIDNLAVTVGLRTYELKVEEAEFIDIDLKWQGLTFGGIVRF